MFAPDEISLIVGIGKYTWIERSYEYDEGETADDKIKGGEDSTKEEEKIHECTLSPEVQACRPILGL